MRRTRLGAAAALLSSGAALAGLTAGGDARAEAGPGQPVLNDYGQSPAEVAAEVSSAVAASPAVVVAKGAVAARHRALLVRLEAESVARSDYLAAVRSGNATRIATTLRSYRAAHALTVSAREAEVAAKAALARLVVSTTAAVRARHYLPVDGTYTGDVSQYFVPGVGLEPIQVRITLYGGHVSDIDVPVHVTTGESGAFNARALPVLMEAAMAAHDTASVAVVSGASLTSGAFVASLQSALTKAGFSR